MVNPPLPDRLNPILHARTTVMIGAFTRVAGDVASTGLDGSVTFDAGSSQDFSFPSFNVLANTVVVNTNAQVQTIYGNDLTILGSASQRLLGLDPSSLPQIPDVTAAVPGSVSVSLNENQSKQLCPGAYGAISLGVNAVLNLNGGVYQVNRLTLADGARLEPSEPVVILVKGAITTGIGSTIVPSAQALDPMNAGDIRIETGGAVTLGNDNLIRAHLLVTGKFSTGRNLRFSGAAWARTIAIGPNGSVAGQGSLSASTPSVPPPCNDNNTCTVDTCVGGGTTAAFCRNAPAAAGALCQDDNFCNGVETCDGHGACQPGQNVTVGASCADDTLCNGSERCDGVGTCQPGEPPQVNDGNPCTADACDPTTGVAHVNVPDGTRCNSFGVCQGGVCSVQGAVFSESFTSFGSVTQQCASWNDFLDNRLSSTAFQSVAVNGTFDSTGATCGDPDAATQICGALHRHASASVSCQGHTWNIGECGGTELSVDNPVCVCSFGRTLRPCIFENWGGVGTETCFAPDQTMAVVCQ